MGRDGRLRVLALIDNMGCGGAELLLSEFAREAPDAGIDLSVVYLTARRGEEAADRLREAGVEPTLVPVARMVGPRDLRRVRAHLRQARPDVVHTHLGVSDWMGGLAARSLGIPAVSTLHSANWTADSAADTARLRLSALARRHCALRIIGVSESARRTYLATGWDRADRVTVIHNGVAAAGQPGRGRQVRRALGIPETAPLVAMISTLRPEKAHEAAFRALPALRQRFPALRLVVVGDGPDRSRLEPMARAADGAVVMTGYRDDVMAVMDAADVLLHPSRIEAFPTTLLEAMAASVPVVATAVGGIPEIVHDGETGLLISPPPDPGRIAAAVSTLLEDGDLRRRLGAAGRTRFEETFTRRRWVQLTRRAYDDVLSARNRTAAR
jgi:glycosyltransferase involved in cell wall biosynthesis